MYRYVLDIHISLFQSSSVRTHQAASLAERVQDLIETGGCWTRHAECECNKEGVCGFYEQCNRFRPGRQRGGGGLRLFIAALLIFRFVSICSSSPSLWAKVPFSLQTSAVMVKQIKSVGSEQGDFLKRSCKGNFPTGIRFT